MSTISSPGLGSGLDVGSIVTQLVALERRPIEQLQSQATTIQTRLSSYGLLQSYTVNLRDIADRLARPDFWTGTTASSSDAAAVGVSSTARAGNGTYAVEVSKLAKAQSLASGPFAAPSSTVGTGTLHLQFGAWDSGLTSFTPDAVRPPVDIAIGSGEDTLEKIRDKVNAAKAGVTASIVNDANGTRLSLRSDATGATQAMRITVTDADGVGTDASGLSALAFDPPAAGRLTQTLAGQNAEATLNGLAISSASNTVTDVIDGVTLTLSKQTTAPVDVKVSLDSATLKKAIGDFAKAYSEMNAYIATQTKYDPATKKAAALQGDRSTLTVQSNLRNVFIDSSSASAAFARLSDIGLQVQANGAMTVNDAKLSAALANPAEVAKLFSSTAGPSAGEHGFAVRVKALANQLIGSDGAISARTRSLRESITRNAAQQEKLEQRVALVQQRLTRQYSALDTQVSRIRADNSSLSQALAALAAQSEAIAKG